MGVTTIFKGALLTDVSLFLSFPSELQMRHPNISIHKTESQLLTSTDYSANYSGSNWWEVYNIKTSPFVFGQSRMCICGVKRANSDFFFISLLNTDCHTTRTHMFEEYIFTQCHSIAENIHLQRIRRMRIWMICKYVINRFCVDIMRSNVCRCHCVSNVWFHSVTRHVSKAFKSDTFFALGRQQSCLPKA
jgi:hypothetical protein